MKLHQTVEVVFSVPGNGLTLSFWSLTYKNDLCLKNFIFFFSGHSFTKYLGDTGGFHLEETVKSQQSASDFLIEAGLKSEETEKKSENNH